MSEVPVLPPEQPASPTSSRRPSVDHDAFADKPVRRPFQTLYEQQGRKPIGVSSAPTSRRGSIVQIPVLSRRPSIASIGSSGAVFNESDFQPETPPATKTPVPDPAPPIPDFDHPPYAKPLGRVFEGDEWDPLVDRLDDKAIKILVACEYLAKGLNLPFQKLQRTGLHYNIMALDEETLVEITRDCWYIMYEIIADGLGWTDLLNRRRSLLERLKRNVRQSQPRARWDIPCDILLSLGFTESWLYE